MRGSHWGHHTNERRGRVSWRSGESEGAAACVALVLLMSGSSGSLCAPERSDLRANVEMSTPDPDLGPPYDC